MLFVMTDILSQCGLIIWSFRLNIHGTVLLDEVVEAAEEIIDEEKDISFKTGYITLYTKLFRAHKSRT